MFHVKHHYSYNVKYYLADYQRFQNLTIRMAMSSLFSNYTAKVRRKIGLTKLFN